MDTEEGKVSILSTPPCNQDVRSTITSPPAQDLSKFSRLPGFIPETYTPPVAESFPDHSDLSGEMSILYKKQYPDTVEKINDRYPINADLAGQKYPLSRELEALFPEGVWFKENGYPDFSPYAIKEVILEGLTADRGKDGRRATKASGLTSKPDDYVWHHVEDGKTMQLVPKKLHNFVKHTGGGAKQIEKTREK